MSGEIHSDHLIDPLGEDLDERLRSVKSPSERRTIAGLLGEISHLPLEHTRAVLETAAAIAGVSLRASIEFLRAAPEAAQILEQREERPRHRIQDPVGARLRFDPVQRADRPRAEHV